MQENPNVNRIKFHTFVLLSIKNTKPVFRKVYECSKNVSFNKKWEYLKGKYPPTDFNYRQLTLNLIIKWDDITLLSLKEKKKTNITL